MANRLQLSKSKSTTIISGIGASDILSKENVILYMQASDGSYSTSLSAVIVPTITTLQPETNLSNVKWNIPANITLADPSFFRPQKIDLLIGVSLFFELLCVGQICLKQGLPILQKTRLGWIVAGKVEVGSSKAVVCAATSSNYADTSLNDLVKSSWEIEDCAEENIKRTKEDLNLVRAKLKCMDFVTLVWQLTERAFTFE
ncbi:PREDICTED: uncharacterized protein LOC108371608 [Rhagoletis zephyria]|uniref:uncharacterized protein LOC108371608 n=1 Tax=Rhagoletis zephyria TaxID=28612 RepID=UPI000811566D|nr:PREDICTED: uncharacterized protein LOC108371608 [Rhagoletis zephyria]